MKRLIRKSHQSLNKETLSTMHPYELANVYRKKNDKEKILSILPMDQVKNLFVEITLEEQRDLLSYLDAKIQKQLLTLLDSDDLKEFVFGLREGEQQIIMEMLPKVRRKTLELLMAYDEDSAASIMATEFITIRENETIKAVTKKTIQTSKESDYVETLFVVSDEGVLKGVVDLKDLILARPTDTLQDITIQDFHFVYEDDSIEKAIQTVKDYDRNVIPVLNHNQQLLGIITSIAVMDELVEELDYHYQKMALLEDWRIGTSAIKRSKQRLPWLMIDVLLSLVLATVLSIFEQTLVQVVALVLFQPLILGMAGNIGTQSLAVTILGLHLGDIEDDKTTKSHVASETKIGFINSLLLALIAFVFVYLFLTIVPTGTQSAISIALVVSLALFGSMFVSAIIGSFIPIFFKKLKIDPAAASGPIMTTINDVVALLLYFGIATLMFLS